MRPPLQVALAPASEEDLANALGPVSLSPKANAAEITIHAVLASTNEILVTVPARPGERVGRLKRRILEAATGQLASSHGSAHYIFHSDLLHEDTTLESAGLKNNSKVMLLTSDTTGGGNLAATVYDDGEVALWNLTAGVCLRSLQCHSKHVSSLCFSPDGSRILTASIDGCVRLWSVVDGSCLLTFGDVGGPAADSAEVSQNGKMVLVTCLSMCEASVWCAEKGTRLHTLKGHGAYVVCAKFSLDGRMVVTSSLDGTAKIWEIAKGGHDAGLHISASVRCTSQIQEHAEGACLHTLAHVESDLNKAGVNVASFSPSNKLVLTASSDCTAKIWSVTTGGCLRTLAGHTGSVKVAVFSRDGCFAMTGSGDHTARLWQAEDGACLKVFDSHHASIIAAAFAPNGMYVLTLSEDSFARLWNIQTGQHIRVLGGHHGPIRAANFSSDSSLVLSASEDGLLRVWSVDASEAECVWALRSKSSARLICARTHLPCS